MHLVILLSQNHGFHDVVLKQFCDAPLPRSLLLQHWLESSSNLLDGGDSLQGLCSLALLNSVGCAVGKRTEMICYRVRFSLILLPFQFSKQRKERATLLSELLIVQCS